MFRNGEKEQKIKKISSNTRFIRGRVKLLTFFFSTTVMILARQIVVRIGQVHYKKRVSVYLTK